jgi:hypothetical protein
VIKNTASAGEEAGGYLPRSTLGREGRFWPRQIRHPLPPPNNLGATAAHRVVYLIDVYLIGVYPTGMHLIGVYLMGVYLMGRIPHKHLVGVHLTNNDPY